MGKIVVAISVGKVQTFVYHAIKGHSAKMETEDRTLENIQLASKQISHDFKKIIKDKFCVDLDDEILFISGKAIFYSDLSNEQIRLYLIELYQLYYYRYRGDIQLMYTYFEVTENTNCLDLINQCNKRLKSRSCMNQMISDNQQILFQFPTEYSPDELVKSRAVLAGFTESINKLAFKKYPTEEEDGGRIAVIKADIDRMGSILESIKDYRTYQRLSGILEEKVSLEYLNSKLIEYMNKNSNQEVLLFPFYVAGDDLFIATSIKDIRAGVEVISQLMEDINKEIKTLGIECEQLSISIGIDITFVDQPIRYYVTRAERQLDTAKQNPCQDKNEDGELRSTVTVSIYDTCYYQYKENGNDPIAFKQSWVNLFIGISEVESLTAELKESHKPMLNRLLKAIREYREADKNQENEQKFINQILYELQPSYLKEGYDKQERCRADAYLKYLIIKPLFHREKDKKTNKNCYRIMLNDLNMKLFESQIRMYLCLTDLRFTVDQKEPPSIVNERFKTDPVWIWINKWFLKPVENYLFVQFLDNKFGKVFVTTRTTIDHKLHYDKIRLEKSMFFRIKKFLVQEEREDAIEKIKTMLQYINPLPDENDPEKSYFKNFDPVKFMDLADKNLNEAFIDSLMLFYEYYRISRVIKKYEKLAIEEAVKSGGKRQNEKTKR